MKKQTAAKKSTATSSAAKARSSVQKAKSAAAKTQKYKVRKGDSLYTIARKHGMSLAELKRINGLKDARLKPGQRLVVSVKKGRQHNDDATGTESLELIAPLANATGDGLFEDSLAEVGIEPIARTYLSIPYRYGAQSRKSTDCSGFVQQVFREFDIRLPRTAREQYTVGAKIDRASLASGDLLFFRTRARKKYPTHVGIYLGNGKMIHASSRQRKVVISDVNHPYYVKRYVGAKRAATFLPGEIDLEMLARQVTGFETDAPLAEAIAAEVQDETETAAAVEAAHLQPDDAVREVIMEAGYDDRFDPADALDDIDGDVEPEPEIVIPVPPALGAAPAAPESETVADAAEGALRPEEAAAFTATTVIQAAPP